MTHPLLIPGITLISIGIIVFICAMIIRQSAQTFRVDSTVTDKTVVDSTKQTNIENSSYALITLGGISLLAGIGFSVMSGTNTGFTEFKGSELYSP